MVSAAGCHDASGSLFFAQAQECIGSTSKFKGASRLKVLAFEPNLLTQHLAPLHRRWADVGLNSSGGALDIGANIHGQGLSTRGHDSKGWQEY